MQDLLATSVAKPVRMNERPTRSGPQPDAQETPAERAPAQRDGSWTRALPASRGIRQPATPAPRRGVSIGGGGDNRRRRLAGQGRPAARGPRSEGRRRSPAHRAQRRRILRAVARMLHPIGQGRQVDERPRLVAERKPARVRFVHERLASGEARLRVERRHGFLHRVRTPASLGRLWQRQLPRELAAGCSILIRLLLAGADRRLQRPRSERWHTARGRAIVRFREISPRNQVVAATNPVSGPVLALRGG